nr:MAG: hypothetical protein DIU78_22055 [Pseudomonadota bacterium]
MSFLAAAACGGDDDESGGAAVREACSEYCTAAQAAGCGLYASESECIAEECSGFEAAPKACQDAFRQYYECLLDQANVCDTGCSADIGACL